MWGVPQALRVSACWSSAKRKSRLGRDGAVAMQGREDRRLRTTSQQRERGRGNRGGWIGEDIVERLQHSERRIGRGSMGHDGSLAGAPGD
jgi:hypothetical protein